jgi:hypothetical protein
MLAVCAAVQIPKRGVSYRARMNTFSNRPLDFRLLVQVNPLDAYEWSKVLLARADAAGTLELLTIAWERVLGYGRREFGGKTLCQLLMWSNRAAAAEVVSAILDERSFGPVDLTLRCRDDAAKSFRLHRRIDAHAHRVFILAQETAGRRSSDRLDEWRTICSPAHRAGVVKPLH